METYRYVILGGGMVAGYAAKEFAAAGIAPGDLAIVSADTALPYERPPLSKGFLAGKEDAASILINDDAFYRDHGIAVHLNTPITSLDLSHKRLRAENGAEFGFDKLLIATGAQPRTLDVPGAEESNILYLRSLHDSQRIREHAQHAQHAVVLGSGFIGMEVAAVLASQGVATTMVFPDERVWQRFFTQQMSAFFERYYREHGVTIAPHVRPIAVTGNGDAQGMNLDDGRHLPADLVVAGIGVTPATDLFATSGLTLDNGILVNEYLETNLPDVYAAGDIANYRDVLCNTQRRVEHWDNAVAQGQHAARMMLGQREPFKHVPYFFSDEFDLSWEFWGDTQAADQAIHRGDLDSGSFSVWWLKDERLVGAFVMNRADEERERAPEWIAAQQSVDPEALRDESQSLRAA